jgi:hypothetical protein
VSAHCMAPLFCRGSSPLMGILDNGWVGSEVHAHRRGARHGLTRRHGWFADPRYGGSSPGFRPEGGLIVKVREADKARDVEGRLRGRNDVWRRVRPAPIGSASGSAVAHAVSPLVCTFMDRHEKGVF